MIVTLTSAEVDIIHSREKTEHGNIITHPRNYEYAEMLKKAGYSVLVAVAEKKWDSTPIVNVEVKSVEDVMNIPKVLGCDVILQHEPEVKPTADYECDIMVYDDYLE